MDICDRCELAATGVFFVTLAYDLSNLGEKSGNSGGANHGSEDSTGTLCEGCSDCNDSCGGYTAGLLGKDCAGGGDDGCRTDKAVRGSSSL